MRIIHVVENLNRGGLERVVVDLSREQINMGHQVCIICLYGMGGLANEAIDNGCRVLAVNRKNGVDISALFILKQLINRFDPDVIHTHNSLCNYFTVLVQAFNRVPIINTRHGMGEHNKSPKRELLYKVSLIRTSVVIAVCDEARRNFITGNIVSDKKSLVVKNGIDIHKYSTPDLRKVDDLRKKLGIKDDSIVLGSVGRLVSYKNHLSLVKAVSEVEKNVVLIIVGGGELYNDILENIKISGLDDRVMLVGDQDDVVSYLALFDIFVMPSVTEGYSLSLLEAFAAHLPVLCTDVGGNTEIVEDGVNGVIIDNSDVVSIRNGIEIIISVNYNAYGIRGYEWVSKFGTTKKVYSDYMDIYRKVIK